MGRTSSICVLAVAAISLVSCVPQASTEAPPAANQTASGTNEATTQPAQQSVYKGTDIATYPGAGVRVSHGDEVLDWNTPDSSATVVAFYRSELGKKGWQINEEWTKKVLSPAEPAEHVRLIAVKGDSVAEIDISPDELAKGKTAIHGGVMEKVIFLQANPIFAP